MSAGIQFSGYLGGHSQGVWFTYGWPNTWALNWSVHTRFSYGLVSARMGLVLPVGAETPDDKTQTYFLLIQNAADSAGWFDAVFQFEQF
jgi:hypothetical protein